MSKSKSSSITKVVTTEPVERVEPVLVEQASTKKAPTPIELFQHNLQRYEAAVLPALLNAHGIAPAQFRQIVISEVKKNPNLLDAFISNPASMYASILAGAEIGLIPSELMGEFYLIPRYIDKKLSVTPLIGYKGLVSILLRSGKVTKLHAEVVYQGDEFKPIYGLEPNIIHVPDFNKPRNAGLITFVYAVAKMSNGEYQFAVLSRESITAIKSLSRYNNELYFNDKDDPNHWMLKKTALLQLSKMLPKDYYGSKAVALDNSLESGSILTLDDSGLMPVVVNGGTHTNALKNNRNQNTLQSLPDL